MNIFPSRIIDSVNGLVGKVKIAVLRAVTLTGNSMSFKDQDGNEIDSIDITTENVGGLEDRLNQITFDDVTDNGNTTDNDIAVGNIQSTSENSIIGGNQQIRSFNFDILDETNDSIIELGDWGTNDEFLVIGRIYLINRNSDGYGNKKLIEVVYRSGFNSTYRNAQLSISGSDLRTGTESLCTYERDGVTRMGIRLQLNVSNPNHQFETARFVGLINIGNDLDSYRSDQVSNIQFYQPTSQADISHYISSMKINGFDVFHKGNLTKLSQLENDPAFIKDVNVIDSNGNPTRHKISQIGTKSIYETVTKLNPTELQGTTLPIKLVNENGIEQVISVDLSNLVTNNSGISNASYNASTNIITIEEIDGDVWDINLGEFSIIVNTNAEGVTTLTQEGVVKATLSRVGQTGRWQDILEKPTTLEGYGIEDADHIPNSALNHYGQAKPKDKEEVIINFEARAIADGGTLVRSIGVDELPTIPSDEISSGIIIRNVIVNDGVVEKIEVDDLQVEDIPDLPTSKIIDYSTWELAEW